MRQLPILVVVLLAATACTTPESGETTTTSMDTTTTTTVEADVPVCLAGELPFVDEGVVAALDSPGQDARAIGGVRWLEYGGCERIEVSFLSAAGSPASRIGPIGVTSLPESGILRVTLSEPIANSAVADTTLDGDLVGSWYVVEGLDEGLTIDFHLDSPADTRAFTTASPARLVVDLRPAADDQPPGHTVTGGGVVVLSPQPGVGLYPMQVTGYAAPNMSAVRMQLSDDSGIVVDRSISTLSSVYVWHVFGVTVNDGPSGLVDLFVGTVDENDERSSGVNVELDLP
ncbi:MAG: hypothetical protein ABFR89_04730 [Actinomycetota bacterium]